jgi:hypothetical protein
MPDRSTAQECRICGIQPAHAGQTFELAEYPGECTVTEIPLCAGCTRQMRRNEMRRDEMRRELPVVVDSSGSTGHLTRHELIARLDRFFAAAGVFEICGACHRQGTGCCPPTCRVMGRNGCDPDNRYGKTLFCAAFICSALLNAIAEIDPETGRTLRWIKGQIGPTEYHIYEMITRVPAAAREPERPIRLPATYPIPPLDGRGELIRESLISMSDEILEIRRNW